MGLLTAGKRVGGLGSQNEGFWKTRARAVFPKAVVRAQCGERQERAQSAGCCDMHELARGSHCCR